MPNRLLSSFICVLFASRMALTGAPTEDLERAFEIVSTAVERGAAPGAAAAIAVDGKIVFERACGVADLKTRKPFQPDTIAWIASLTKPVTAAAAMMLVDRGLLGLDDSVGKYLPAFRRHPIIVRQLMSHSSGIQSSVPLRPRYFFEQGWYRRSLSEAATAIAETPLVFEPGAKAEYSNAAPYVLGRIVEVQAKQGFGDYVREHVLQPLEMADTGFSISADKISRAAVVYRREGAETTVYCKFDPSWDVRMTMPDGGLFSTPRDIVKFAASFVAERSPILSGRAGPGDVDRADWRLRVGLDSRSPGTA